MSQEKKIWFPLKSHGYGWGPPCCWQGWLVLLVYIALLASISWLISRNESPTLYTTCVTGLTAMFIGICIWKGGRPRWRWGN